MRVIAQTDRLQSEELWGFPGMARHDMAVLPDFVFVDTQSGEIFRRPVADFYSAVDTPGPKMPFVDEFVQLSAVTQSSLSGLDTIMPTKR